jgi:hypothetical protein
MAVLNPEHFFEQAERLMSPLPAGAPRQVDLRRAISGAYYGLFHFIMTEMADEFIGRTRRGSARYTMVYRSLDHRPLKSLCQDLQKTTPPAKYSECLPPSGMGDNIAAFAAAVVDLQEKRHSADYDPGSRFKMSDAQIAVRTARRAIDRFKRASAERRKTFLTLLLCPPRQG